MSGAVESIEVGGAVRVDRAAGLGPYTLARRRLLRNRTAMVSLVVFVLVVIACLAAPLYAHDVAHVDPFQSNVNGTTIVNGKSVPILQQGAGALGIGTTPIGPTWDFRHYFLGADPHGRDVFARLLYGGRTRCLSGSPRPCLLRPRNHRRRRRGLLRRLHRRAHLAPDGRDLVVPGLPARNRDLDRHADQRPRPRVRARCPRRASGSRSWSSRSSSFPTSPARSAARCCRCAARSSSRPPSRTAPVRAADGERAHAERGVVRP